MTHDWSRVHGGGGYDISFSAATDASGNVILAGEFYDSIDFGGGALTNVGNSDIFLAKLDAAGNHLWSQRFGDSSFSTHSASIVTTDASGNVVMTGSTSGPVDFGGGTLPDSGGADGYVVKFDATGNHLWSLRFGDDSHQRGRSVAVDTSGNVLLLAQFAGTLDVGDGPLVSAGKEDILLAKFDPSGNHLWSQRFGDAEIQKARSIASDAAGNIVLCGEFRGSVDFGGGPLSSTGSGSFDIYLARFDASGNHLWSRRFGDASNQWSQTLTVDSQDDIVLTGWFQGGVDFGGGRLTSSGDDDAYLAKFDASGNHLWSQRFGDANPQNSYGVTTDSADNIILTGFFRGDMDLGGGTLTSAGSPDIFIARFDPSGLHHWSERYGDADEQYAYSVVVDPSNATYVTGDIAGDTFFGGDTLTAVDATDVFLLRLSSDQPVSTGPAPTPVGHFGLEAASPNPFGSETMLSFALSRAGKVRISVYDVMGRRVRTLTRRHLGAGRHSLTWTGRDDRGEPLGPGVYFVRLESREGVRATKVTLR